MHFHLASPEFLCKPHLCKCSPQNTASKPRSGCVLMLHVTSPGGLYALFPLCSVPWWYLICFFRRSRRREGGGYALGEGKIKLNSHRSCWLSVFSGCLFIFPPAPWRTLMFFPSLYGEISWSAQYFRGLGRSYLNKENSGGLTCPPGGIWRVQ